MQIRTANREVVIEYERIQLIRKRAKTNLVDCRDCGRTADHIGLETAAALFETTKNGLSDFVERNHCHHHATAAGTLLCLESLLAVMNNRQIGRGKLLGEIK